jgi:hypothetical protein
MVIFREVAIERVVFEDGRPEKEDSPLAVGERHGRVVA